MIYQSGVREASKVRGCCSASRGSLQWLEAGKVTENDRKDKMGERETSLEQMGIERVGVARQSFYMPPTPGGSK